MIARHIAFVKRYGLPLAGIVGSALWFSWDLITLKRFLNHPEYVHYYHSFRIWFLDELLQGNFLEWNPYWGIGHSTEIESSFPVDIWTPLELIAGPQYHLFQAVQALVILLVGFWALRSLKTRPLAGWVGVLLFFFAPWVNYFFFYYIKAASYVGLLLQFPLTIAWFYYGKRWSVWLMPLVTVVALMGTKLEFSFFYLTFFLGVSIFAAAWLCPKELRISRFLHFWAALLLGVGLLSWAWIPILQILFQADRLGSPLGLKTFASEDFWYKFCLSLASSEFLKVLFICQSFLYAIRMKKIWAAGAGLVGAIVFHFWKFDLFQAFLSWPGLGLSLALVVSFAFRKPKHSFVCLLWTLPLATYWLRVEPTDLKEMEVLQTAPALLQCLGPFLLFWGCWKFSRMGKVIYATLLLLFVLRTQGQVLLAYTLGFLWIPTRDSFLFEWLFALLSVRGLMLLTRQRAQWVPAVMALAILFASSRNFYASHPLIADNDGRFPYYQGVPEIRELFARHRGDTLYRVYFADPDAATDLPMYGSSVLEKVSQVHLFSSFISKRYHDFSIREWFGLPPEAGLHAYEGEYTERTVRLLPFRNRYGMSTNQVYWHQLHALPPPTLESLKSLSVSHVYSKKPFEIFGQPATKEGAFYRAVVPDTHPRAYLKEGRVAQTITGYSPERVAIEVEAHLPSLLVLTDLYHPFWSVKVDGQAAAMEAVDSLFRGVRVPAGRHEVIFECAIPYFWWGVGLSLVALLAYVLWVVSDKYQLSISLASKWMGKPSASLSAH